MASCVEVAGWLKIPVETTISRILKKSPKSRSASLNASPIKLRGQIWRKANRAGVSKVGLNPVQGSILIPPLIRCAAPKRAPLKVTTPRRKGALSYHPQLAFWAGSKEIVQAWFRRGAPIPVWSLNLSNNYWPTYLTKRGYIRADSRYFVGGLIGLAGYHKHEYLIKVQTQKPGRTLTGNSGLP